MLNPFPFVLICFSGRAGDRLPVFVGRHPVYAGVGSESRKTCVGAQIQGFCDTDYRNQRLGRETGNGRPFAITPAGAPYS